VTTKNCARRNTARRNGQRRFRQTPHRKSTKTPQLLKAQGFDAGAWDPI